MAHVVAKWAAGREPPQRETGAYEGRRGIADPGTFQGAENTLSRERLVIFLTFGYNVSQSQSRDFCFLSNPVIWLRFFSHRHGEHVALVPAVLRCEAATF